MKTTLTELDRLHKQITPPAPADKYVAQAIWQTLREAKTPEARKLIIESDPAIMSAVAYAPASVSGMTQAERDHLVQTWSRTNFPEESGRVLRLSKALEDARRVSISGEKYFQDLVRVMTSPTIAESAKRVEAAQDAAVAAATGQ